jgi:hypothetical protein
MLQGTHAWVALLQTKIIRVRAATLDAAPFILMETLTQSAHAVKSITAAEPNGFYKQLIKITVIAEKTIQ